MLDAGQITTLLWQHCVGRGRFPSQGRNFVKLPDSLRGLAGSLFSFLFSISFLDVASTISFRIDSRSFRGSCFQPVF